MGAKQISNKRRRNVDMTDEQYWNGLLAELDWMQPKSARKIVYTNALIYDPTGNEIKAHARSLCEKLGGDSFKYNIFIHQPDNGYWSLEVRKIFS